MSLNTVASILTEGKVIDIGCGTGRLAIPLAQNNYQVVGVDVNSGMLSALNAKAQRFNLSIPTFTDINHLEDQDCDLALTVFTVLSYILDEDGLLELFQNINRHLKPGASFLFDLASPAAFSQTNNTYQGNGLNGVVNVQFINPGGPIANYSEEVVVNRPDEFVNNHTVTEFFQIRCWTLNEITSLLAKSGFGFTRHIPGYAGMGAEYYVCKKEV
jgi:SAM-dependent methyltransferase